MTEEEKVSTAIEHPGGFHQQKHFATMAVDEN